MGLGDTSELIFSQPFKSLTSHRAWACMLPEIRNTRPLGEPRPVSLALVPP